MQPQVHLVSCQTVVEIKQTCLYCKRSDINSRWETFQSSVIVQVKSEFQIFPATTGNFSANGHLVRKSDVHDDDAVDNDDHADNVDDRTNDVNIA